MASWKTVESELVDTSVAYADGDDIFGVYIRNIDYGNLDGNSTPTKSQVDRLIDRMSEYVDTTTGRAWRIRKVADLTVPVKLSHTQKHARHRRRRLRGKGMREKLNVNIRGYGELPHFHLKSIDSAKGDSVVALQPRNETDLTDNEGRADGDYVLDKRKGIIRPEITNFTAVGTRIQGPAIENPKLRVTYRYGLTNATTDSNNDGVSDTVPGDIREAVAMLVAAKLIETDQYGELLPANTGDSPDLPQASKRLRDDAEGVLDQYRRVR